MGHATVSYMCNFLCFIPLFRINKAKCQIRHQKHVSHFQVMFAQKQQV